MSRRIFIGDIQGCRVELEDLLEELNYDPASDTLIPVGDLVNRGPDSLGVLRLLHSEDASAILGNHDVHALRVVAGTRTSGRRDTLEALLEADDRDELLDWLAGLPLARGYDDLLCVHAGVHPQWANPVEELTGIDPLLLDQRTDFATRVRYCDERGEQPEYDWPEPLPPFVPWYRHWQAREDDRRTVVFGHWARAGLTILPRVRGLDTGCVWGRQLTAWIAEEDRLVHVDARRAWAAIGS